MTPAGIETTTFRFVAQHLNHCATAVSMTFNAVTQTISITKNLVLNVSKQNYIQQMLTYSRSVQQQAQTTSTYSHAAQTQTFQMFDSVQNWVISQRQTNQI